MARRITKRCLSRLLGGTTLVFVCLATVGCGGGRWKGFDREPDPEYLWPAPPQKPRVAYVTSVRDHEDLFKTGGAFNWLAELVGGPEESGVVRPFAVAFHPRGGLLVGDPGARLVHFFDWENRQYHHLGDELEGGLPSPVGVGVLPSGDIIVSDSKRGSVERFSPSGDLQEPFVPNGTLGRPAGIAVDHFNGEVFIADVTNHRIAVFDDKGELLREIGERGGEKGAFNFPSHLATGPSEELIISDSMNFRVQVLTRSGEPTATIGSPGQGAGQFSKPKGVAMDSDGNVIAVEGLYDALNFFNESGDLLLTLGSPGSEPGQFWLPAGLAIDREKGLLAVADSYNSRVQIFRLLDTANPEATP